MAFLIKHVHGKFKKVCVWGISEESIFTYVDHFCTMVNLLRLALGIFINIIFVVTRFYNAVMLHA